MIPWAESIRCALKSIAAERVKASLTTLAVVSGSISWTAVVIALLVPTGIGVLFGYRPAAETAKLSPIEAFANQVKSV